MGKPTVNIKSWLTAPLTTDIERATRRIGRAPGVLAMALMPDVHLAGEVCIGTVIASPDRIFPQAVGSDIGCGMSAVRFHSSADPLLNTEKATILLKHLSKTVPAIMHKKEASEQQMPQDLLDQIQRCSALNSHQKRDGLLQFGTLGRGNHFIEFQKDPDGDLWLMLHSGSRALGQCIAAHHLATAQNSKSLFSLKADTKAGRSYLEDAQIAMNYAGHNRKAMANAVAEIMSNLFSIKPDWPSFIDCSHNHVKVEQHLGQTLYVHRKGANAAHKNEKGIIPGSMGTSSYHVVGRGCKDALCSSSHGAGRVMSRGEARHRLSPKQFEKQMDGIFFDRNRVKQLIDESPGAYKNIDTVMRAQKKLVKRVRKLQPLLSYKGG